MRLYDQPLKHGTHYGWLMCMDDPDGYDRPCVQCRRWKADEQVRLRRNAEKGPMPEGICGVKLHAYTYYGCRCEKCRKLMSDYHKGRKKRAASNG